MRDQPDVRAVGRTVDRAAAEVIAQDDFGPVDQYRWRAVPCAAQRPQRAYELNGSDEPIPEHHAEAIIKARQKLAEVLKETDGRDLTVEDVQEGLQYINPTGVDRNCVECSKAVDDMFRRHAAVAGTTSDQDPHHTDNALSARAINYTEDIKPVDIELDLLEAGDGARGIVVAWRLIGAAHAYNVANIQGEIQWIDGQNDIVQSYNPHRWNSFEFYRTA